ncbi:hypothetical protein SAMN04489761_4334 [Tenacibaculum sp. MAR_2009_124]|uniref:DUF6904 family protein n=1 Tax=Tenacibaculum sp. MAR_2009_124 TaxID=1250059 RepID=UPI000896D4EE|nr:hypothetical protein [Tenacibaculum sp. MAR_2009_124]SED12017.1 hypothetical protein SAMN04489761_4334 [Tenacibaculum sp. MAR_2009_124]
MFYTKPTKNGIGIEIWGTHDDIYTVHSIIQKFWGNENNDNIKNSDQRDNTISGLSRELRKAHEGSRLKRKNSHFSFEEIEHFGCKISWVHIIFSLSALRYNMRYSETNKLELSILMQFEYWLEKSAIAYDGKNGMNLEPFFNGAINGGDQYIYLLLWSIDADFLRLKGGKRAFRKLPQLLKRGVMFTPEYQEYEKFIKSDLKRLNCEISQLEIDDSDIDYENLKW